MGNSTTSGEGKATRPGQSHAWLPGGIALLGLVTLFLNFSLPWLYVADFASFPCDYELEGHVDRRELADACEAGVPPYMDQQLWWPWAALAAAALASLCLLLPARWRSPSPTRVAAAAWTVIALAGFVVALTGTRWLGMLVMHAWEPEDVSTHLHLVPYLNLVVGFLLLGIAASRIHAAGWWAGGHGASGPDESLVVWGRWSLFLSMGGLLVLPLLPYQVVTTTFLFEGRPELAPYGGALVDYNGELGLAYGAADDALPWHEAGVDLMMARLMLWVILYLAVATLAWAPWAPQGWRDRFPWAAFLGPVGAGMALVAATVFTILLYIQIPNSDGGDSDVAIDAEMGTNFLLPVLLGALWVVGGIYAWSMLGGAKRSAAKT